MSLMRERSDIQSQLEENEEDLADIMKKYKAVVNQSSVDQITINDQLHQVEELATERDRLKNEVGLPFSKESSKGLMEFGNMMHYNSCIKGC